MDKKRIIYLILFIILCVLIGFAIYTVFFKKKLVTPPTGGGEITTGEITGGFPTGGAGQPGGVVSPGTGLPTTGEIPSTIPETGVQAPVVVPSEERIIPGIPYKTLDLPIIDPVPDTQGTARFYNDVDGKFYRLNKDGTTKALTDEVFYNVKNVVWSKTTDASIIEYPDGSNIYYNFETKEKATLPKHWEDFNFSPTGNKIVAKSMGMAAENRWLITSDPNGQNIKLIEDMGDNARKVQVNWSPNGQIVATSQTADPISDDRERIYFVGQNEENFLSMVVEGRGYKGAWSPSGDKLLYSIYTARNDFKPELWIVNASGDSIGTGRKMLGLNTWVDKCTFANERYVYCAEPTTLVTGAGFIPATAENTPDRIYKIDLETGIKTEVPLNIDYTISSIFTSPDQKTVYFTSQNNPGIFQLDI